MKESASLRFLYRTRMGRAVLMLLIRPGLSRLAGRFLDTGCSRFLIKPFLRSNGISLEEYCVPQGGFSSFNECFCRKRKQVRFAPDGLCSPCDAYLSVFPITSDSRFSIKHTCYSLDGLLQDSALAAQLEGGTALCFRLMPKHYHRYYYVDHATVLRRKRIEGVLHCVRPIASEQFPIYLQNTREYTVQQTEHFGTIVQMEIGALLVGRICNPPGETRVCRGDEKGYFEYGGSTVLLLLPKQELTLTDELRAGLAANEEVSVKAGDQLTKNKGM